MLYTFETDTDRYNINQSSLNNLKKHWNASWQIINIKVEIYQN